MQTQPNNGTDWSAETRQKFERLITKSRKDFAIVSKELNQSLGNCQQYYYATFKNTNAYEQLKKTLEREMEMDEMISCSICQVHYGIKCLKHPPSSADETWYCHECDP
jgi:hypothetical protein